MNISAKYDPSVTEEKWYGRWLEDGLFRSVPDSREPYTIAIPPPNVTGVLHMGHMLNNTIQDVLMRRARMKGKNGCWVPGTDHASIATEAKVVAMLKERGISKSDLSRQEFLDHAWEWTRKHGGIILEQLKRLGASCDWERTVFTMDRERYDSVIKVFIDLYEKGLIYRGVRMVNWDPQASTALSDEEVNYVEEESKLYYVKYCVAGEDDYVVVATTRPETILGDTAVCANPSDARYASLKGKKIVVPMVNREVPFLFDDYVDMEFGTGVLKITPAHDINDYEIGLRHKLPVIDILKSDGTLSDAAGLFIGEDRFEARKRAVDLLRESGALLKVEQHRNKVGRSERTNAVIEPRLSVQWFLKMEQLAGPALEAVNRGDIEIHPPRFVNVYRHWMENVHDWCISRQLWWGHRIPAYYYGDGDFVVAADADSALKKAREASGNPNLRPEDIVQDEDVLDTWFSSWLWPVTIFNGINDPGNREMKYYYPTNDLITAPEILFFWVARMVVAGYEYEGERPFNNIYLHGLVRDKQRRKMSKSLGNSPDPLELIERYGADGVRVGMLLCSPAGNDLLYDDSLPEQGRNFCNKIWNAFRLVNSWQADESLSQPLWSAEAVGWMEQLIESSSVEIETLFSRFRISDALMALYRLFWEQFSSWYLEIVKPVEGKAIDAETYRSTKEIFCRLMQLIHPFMPFITEEVWHLAGNRPKGDYITTSQLPVGNPDADAAMVIRRFEATTGIVASVRNVRRERQIANKKPLKIVVLSTEAAFEQLAVAPVIARLCNISEFVYSESKPERAVPFMAGNIQLYIPIEDDMDSDAERDRIVKEIEYYTGFLAKVNKKLSNDSFVNNAPAAVVENEIKKRVDAQGKIDALKEQLAMLGG